METRWLMGTVGVALALGCSGLATTRPAPPEILDVRTSSGPCGAWEVEVDAHPDSPGQRVALEVDGQTVAEGPADPEVPLRHRSRSGQGQLHRIAARMGRWEAEAPLLEVERWDLSVEVEPVGILPVNDLPRLELTFQGACLNEAAYRVDAKVGEQPAIQLAPLLSDGQVSGPIPPVPQGRHPLVIEVHDEEGRLALRRRAYLDVGPPCADSDGDGFFCTSDCDDLDPRIHPGAVDVPGNNVDEDCDGVNGVDQDRDGHEDAARGGDDCDDTRADVHPGAPEGFDRDQDGYRVADGVDNDCDGAVDEGALTGDCDDTRAAVNPMAREAPDPNQLDDDCDGVVDEGTVAYDDDGDGWTEERGDCDDGDPATHPDAAEAPDCRDNDCDGDVDETVTRPAVDDGYEPNDALDTPLDLGHSGQRRFHQSLSLVSRDGGDAEWFRFYSNDGFWDDWDIIVTVDALPTGSAYRVGLYTEAGQRKTVQVLGEEGGRISYGGSSGVNDSGWYLLGIEPVEAPRNWCPVQVDLLSR